MPKITEFPTLPLGKLVEAVKNLAGSPRHTGFLVTEPSCMNKTCDCGLETLLVWETNKSDRVSMVVMQRRDWL